MSTTADEYPGVQPYPDDFEHDPTIVKQVIQFPRHRPDLKLPMREGPKLSPFSPFGIVNNLEWVREVAVTEMSAVWKVKVDEQFYALKLFGFPLQDLDDRFEQDRDHLVKDMCDNDAFTCEARAYGRLKETETENIAIKCHGYVLLTPSQEGTFRELATRIPCDLVRRPEYAGFPIRCTIKDWVPEGTPDFTPRMVPRMKRDIATLHAVGIINRDIKSNNYLGGKMFDFGIAWTIPHFYIDQLERCIAEGPEHPQYWFCRREWEELRDVDGDRFDRMIDESNEEGRRGWIWDRYFPNPNYSNLRRRHEVLADCPIRAPNPLKYRWVWNEPVRKYREKATKSPKGQSSGVKKQKRQGKGRQVKK
ncbi:Kinetochore Sim4 complex subunit FTA2 domain containing protein [Naviculisporaceae sp. PSN 640]